MITMRHLYYLFILGSIDEKESDIYELKDGTSSINRGYK